MTANTDFNNLIKKLSALDNQACQEVAATAVKQAGVIVQSQARLLISSDTGALARSVKIKNEVKENQATATVYYEFGTGPNGEANHQGISPQISPKYKQTGWMIPADAMTVDKAEMYGFKVAYKDGEVIGYYTKGQMARPFMYPALHDQEDTINKNTEKLFKNKIRELCKK